MKKKRGNREKRDRRKQKQKKEKLASCVAMISSSGADTIADQNTPLSSSK